MHKWILPTLSEVLALSESTLANCPSEKAEWTVVTQNCQSNITTPVDSTNQNVVERVRAEAEWCGAIAATEQLLLQSINSEVLAVNGHLTPVSGLVFTGPVPVLSHETLVSNLPTWIFTAESLHKPRIPFQLPPATSMSSAHSLLAAQIAPNAEPLLPLLPGDPLSTEQFCLVLTTGFSLVMVLGEDIKGVPAFLFSFEPEVIEQAWRSLRARIVLTSPHFPLPKIDALIEQHYLVVPDYRTVTQFSRLLIKHLPKVGANIGEKVAVANLPMLTRQVSKMHQQEDSSLLPRVSTLSYPDKVIAAPAFSKQENDDSSPRPDVELLKAFAHEVRTPLTTIRTLTRLLLKRCDLATEVIKRLKIIDHECTEQIDRMELLFRAAELETLTDKHTSAHLTVMSLAQVLQQSIPRWQKSASRRNLTLDVVLPQQLPTVVSDPIMLDQVLTGLIENFTRSLSAGSHIQVQVIPAGDQLKLQLLTQSQPGKSDTAEQFPVPPVRQSLGQLLIFHPETGNISLNFAATKHLFQAIGGKLIVRQRPHQGEVLTIFLPMDVSRTDFCHHGKGAFPQSAN